MNGEQQYFCDSEGGGMINSPKPVDGSADGAPVETNGCVEQHQTAGDWEQRLAENIKWIRHEITELKKQDKSLTRQFIELRSVIHHLRRYGFINRLPKTLHEEVKSSTNHIDSIEEDRTNTPPLAPGTPQLSPRKNTSTNWYQTSTLPSKKLLDHHPRGPGEPKASPPKHFFNDDSEPECDSSDSMDDIEDDEPDINAYGFRMRAVSVLTPTCVSSPGGNFLMRSRNMSFTSGATEDEYDC